MSKAKAANHATQLLRGLPGNPPQPNGAKDRAPRGRPARLTGLRIPGLVLGLSIGAASLVIAILVSVGLAVRSAYKLPPLPPVTETVLFALSPIVAAVGLTVVVVAGLAHRRRLKAHGHRLCLYCCYPLDPLAERGVCAECGEPYVLAETIERWKRRPRSR